MWAYHPPAWLPDGHSQTILPSVWASRISSSPLKFCRVRWRTPDGDFIDVDRINVNQNVDSSKSVFPLLVIFHGLEGSSASHYTKAFAKHALSLNCDCAIPHFRGCSGELNEAPRAYHSGDFQEIDWILRRFKAENPLRLIWAVGVSLGGNALVKWAGESGSYASSVVQAIAAICAPLDLVAAGHAMGNGFNRHVYTRVFLKTMIPKAIKKWHQYPHLFKVEKLKEIKTLYEFDNLFTAPLHGYVNTEDYWLKASAKPVLHSIQVPVLLLNARNDPFIPAISLPTTADISKTVTLWQPDHGGHVGFPSRRWKNAPDALYMEMPDHVTSWLLTQH